MTNTEIEKRIAKYARLQAKKIMSHRRSGMKEEADRMQEEAVATVDRMRAGRE